MRKPQLLLILTCLLVSSPQTALAQSWAETDLLFWTRSSNSDKSLITGVGGFNSNSLDFGLDSGYRLTVGTSFLDWEVEAQFSRIDEWSSSTSSALANGLVFDDTGANALIFGAPPAAFGFLNGLFGAATETAAADESTEGEFLMPGAMARGFYDSSLQDFQLNVGSHRDLNWFRWAVGFRNIRLKENGRLITSGMFQAADVDDGALPGGVGNDPNDSLSHAALAAQGYTVLSGAADGFSGFDPTAVPATPTTLATLFGGSTENNLNGIQITTAARAQPNDVLLVEALLRLGLYHNNIDSTINELIVGQVNDDSVYIRRLSAGKNKLSFGVNFGVRGHLNLTDYITLTLGYEILALTGVALAPDQFGSVETNILGAQSHVVDADGLFVGHGGVLGLEVRW